MSASPTPSLKTAYSYTDACGRSWNLKINLGVAQSLAVSNFQAVIGNKPVDLMADPQPILIQAGTNVSFLAAYCWAIVVITGQAAKVMIPEEKHSIEAMTGPTGVEYPPGTTYTDARPMVEEDFIASCDGSTILAMRDALYQAIFDFFPVQRTQLEETVEALTEARRTLTAKQTATLKAGATRAVSTASDHMDKAAKQLGDAFSAQLASLESGRAGES